MLKRNLKFITTTIILLILAMCMFNINTVNATDVTEEDLQNMLNVIPNEMTLDISEIEFEKATTLVEKEIKEIWKNNNIEIGEIDIGVHGAYLYNIYSMNISVSKNNTKSKEIKIIYSNTNQKNATDEQYVKNITIQKIPSYFEVPLNYLQSNINDVDAVTSWLTNYITQYYKSQINNSNITVKAWIGGWDKPGVNLETAEIYVGVFKNGILYKTQAVGTTVTIPVIDVPKTVSNDEINSYVSNLIENTYKNTLKVKGITKGADKAEYFKQYANVPGIYTVVIQQNKYDDSGSVVIIRKTNNSVTKTDNNTNIKLEAAIGIIPENTVLEVQPITEGNTYNIVKKVLTNVEKFVTFDINLLSDGVKIQPNGKVKISIPIPDDFDKNNLVVYRISDNGEKTKYNVTIDSDMATFETDHFSTYVLAEESKQGGKDETPKTGTNNREYYILGIAALIGILVVKKYIN